MKYFRSILMATILAVTLWGTVSCTNPSPQNQNTNTDAQMLRPITTPEALTDFDHLAENFRHFYGPLEYKQERFQFSFEDWVKEIRSAIERSQTEEETLGHYARFISRFKDGHVRIVFPANTSSVQAYKVGVFITPIADKYLVGELSPELGPNQISVGDEVVAIDGETPDQLLPKILKYASFATPESDRHLIMYALSRGFYMTELKPSKNTVKITVRKADGKVISEELPWKLEPWTKSPKFVEDQGRMLAVPLMEQMQTEAGTSIMSMAKPKPFFASDSVLKTYNFRMVTADQDHRKKYGLEEKDAPDIFAALYKFNGRTVLLVRNFVYMHSDFPGTTYMKAYKAILDQWEELADVLVIDQTHNGGGAYCEEFFRLFIQEEKSAFVQFTNADRKWIVSLKSDWGQELPSVTGAQVPAGVFEALGSVVETAYDKGERLTSPINIIGGRNKVTPADYTWKKPMLVLIDELAGSCGDAFPMLIKNNNVAKLFGARTMGLGGNVEGFQLPHSQTVVSITRGLFTSYREDQNYTPDQLIENNGVTPDYPYAHTVEDFRKGFVDYVKAFSQKAVEQIPAGR